MGVMKNTLNGFVKDPYGTASQSSSMGMSASLALLGIQALSFVFFLWGFISKYIDSTTGGYGAYSKDMKKEAWSEIEFSFWLKAALIAVIGIGLLYLSILLATKLARITIDPKTLISAQGMSSIMMSAGILVTGILMLLLGFTSFGFALYILAFSLGSVGSLLILEISLRGVMPAGTGNVTRLVTLTCSYAVTHALTFMIVYSILEDAVQSSLYMLF